MKIRKQTSNTASGLMTVLCSQSQKAQSVGVFPRIAEITFQHTDHLLSDRNSDHSEFAVNQRRKKPWLQDSIAARNESFYAYNRNPCLIVPIL